MGSEIPSGMCAKLRTVAASNNKDHASQSLLLLLARATYIINGVILHAHPVRGESHNQRNITGEVATVPHFACMDGLFLLPVPTQQQSYYAHRYIALT